MKKIPLRSLLFIFYSFALAVLMTAYMGEKIYMLNFYALPILFGAYYFDVKGAAVMSFLSSVMSIFFAHKSGHHVWDTPILTHVVMYFVVGMIVGVFQKENNKLNNYLLHASLTDKLTDLYNYGYFTKRLEEEISRAERYKRPFALIMIDVDYFKKYNDTYGHENGNVVLKKLAEMFAQTIRKSDVAFRYGGEEFVVLLPETSDDAVLLAERLREKAGAIVFPGNTNMTISMGVTCYPGVDKTEPDPVKQADTALYEAKNSGRNKVCLYHSH